MSCIRNSGSSRGDIMYTLSLEQQKKKKGWGDFMWEVISSRLNERWTDSSYSKAEPNVY